MRKRQIQIGLVKTPKGDSEAEVEKTTFEEKALYIAAGVNNLVRQITIGVTAYMAVDTIRKIVINRLSK